MQGLSDFDSMRRSAETKGAATAASHSSDWEKEKRMAGGGVLGVVRDAVLLGVVRQGASGVGVGVLLTSTAKVGRPDQRRGKLLQRAWIGERVWGAQGVGYGGRASGCRERQMGWRW